MPYTPMYERDGDLQSAYDDGSVYGVIRSHNDKALKTIPSTLEVDYDKNITDLYQAITNCDWDGAIDAASRHPDEARTWVVRHYDENDSHDAKGEIMWRFLPIHSASARQPPREVVSALLKAYPDGAKCVDDQGMYALHYACGNQAHRDVIRMLLVAYPEAATKQDPNCMLPLHYLACWGPSEASIMDMVLVAHRPAVRARDADGNTPLDLAMEGDYDERDDVVSMLTKWQSNSNNTIASNLATSRRSSPSSSVGIHSSVGMHYGDKRHYDDKKQFDDKKELDDRRQYEDRRHYADKRQFDDKRQYGDKKPYEDKKLYDDKSQYSDKRDDDIVRKNSSNLRAGSASGRRTPPHITTTPQSPSSPATPFLVGRLKDEISGLKERLKESKWELAAQKNMESQASLKQKVAALEKKVTRQQDELELTREELDEVQNELESKEDVLQQKRKLQEETEKKLREALQERVGLRITLTDLMEQHEKFKKKSDFMNDRLGSLSASLSSMMDQHKTVLKAMRDREGAWKQSAVDRKEQLKILMSLESEVESDDSLEAALDKTNKEMEAIAAVIAAARN